MDYSDRPFRSKTEMLEKMTPEQQTPPDWIGYIIYLIITGLAGALGAFVRQIHSPARKWPQRILEWLGGALCAIYGSEIVASAIHHSLNKFDLIDSSYVVPEKILGLAGFLCGALGVTVIDFVIQLIKNHVDAK